LAERAIGVEFELTRVLLQQSKLPNIYSADARLYASWLLDCRLCENSTDLTPFESWYGKKPALEFMHPFGSVCYGKTPYKDMVNKSLGSRGVECRYLGPSLDQKGFRVLYVARKEIMSTRTLVFVKSDGSDNPVQAATDNVVELAEIPEIAPSVDVFVDLSEIDDTPEVVVEVPEILPVLPVPLVVALDDNLNGDYWKISGNRGSRRQGARYTIKQNYL
jgi:hypothetical protein